MSREGQPAGPGAAKLRDEGQFRAFYDRTSPTAYALALRITGAPDAAADTCEAAYLAAWEAGPEAGAWKDGAVFDRVRSLSFERRTGSALMVSSGGGDPSYTMATAVRDGLAKLDPLGRRAIELAYFGGLSVAEVAEIVGFPVARVRSAMRTALLDLGDLTRDQQESMR